MTLVPAWYSPRPRRRRPVAALLAVVVLVVFGVVVVPVLGTAPPAQAISFGQDAADPGGAVEIKINDNRRLCGGALINAAWVLTAKHCVRPFRTLPAATPATTKVRIGNVLYGQGVEYDVLNIFDDGPDDSALLQLTRRTDRLDLVLPYGYNDPPVGTPATIRGWGPTQANLNQPATTLQIGQNVVASTAPGIPTMELTSTDGSKTQQGDSGGPVTIGGLLCGIHSSTSFLSSTAVKTSAMVPWIVATAHVAPGGACNLDTSKKKKSGLKQRILAIGATQTVGLSGKEIGFRDFLGSMLGRAGLSSSFVGPDRAGPPPNDHVADYGGSFSEIVNLEMEARCAVYDYAPDIVTIVAGENDLQFFPFGAGAPEHLDQLISTVREVSPRTIVLVASIAPAPHQPKVGSEITQYNAAVKKKVLDRAAAGQHIAYVDTSELVIGDSPSVPVDGFDIDNQPVALFPSGFYKEAAAFNLSIDNAVNAGWIPDTLSLNKGPCNGTATTAGASQLRVMAVGDSITAGVNSASGRGYEGPLRDRQTAAGNAVDFVGSQRTTAGDRHEGHSGKEITFIRDQTMARVKEYSPNVVTLLAGTNDIGLGHESGAAQRLVSLVKEIRAAVPDAWVLVGDLLPDENSATSSKHDGFNAEVDRLLVADDVQRVRVVSFDGLNPITEMDGLHPNDTGYGLMATRWSDIIDSLLRSGYVAPRTKLSTATGSGGGHQGVYGPAPGLGAWVPQGQIAWDAGVRGKDVRWADMDGDGKDDYLWVGGNGSVNGWLNRGRAGAPGFIKIGLFASKAGETAESVRLADIDGDAKADYLVVGDHGQVYASLNQGPGADGGWTWRPIGTIATGIAPGDQIQFGDLSGDGRADYLAVDPKSGAVECYLNGGEKPDGWRWDKAGKIASGIGVPGRNARFADINRDGFDDYVGISAVDGTVKAYLSGGQGPAGVRADGTGDWYWFDQGQVAPGIGAPSLDNYVLEADVDGDGRADYLGVNKDGGTSAWLNNGKDTGPVAGWLPRGKIAGGTIGGEYDTTKVFYADLNGDKRADYIVSNIKTGSLSAYLNNGPGSGGWSWQDVGTISPFGQADRSPFQPRFADVDGDGKADYLTISFYTGKTEAYLNRGRSATGWNWDRVILKSDLIPGVVKDTILYDYADVDGDKHPDSLRIDNTNNNGGVSVEFNSGPLDSFGAPTPIGYKADTSGSQLRFPDLNGDGKADYAAITASGGSAYASLNSSVDARIKVTWNPRGSIIGSPAAADERVVFADMDGDDRADYILVKPSGETRLWLNNGTDKR